MRALHTTLLLSFLLAASVARAQTHGYGFAGATFGDGTPGTAFRYGIGGAGAIAPHFSLGGEIGGFANGGSGLLISGNAAGHLRPSQTYGVDPFLTGGLTLGRSAGNVGVWVNIGAGANYWLREHLGARAEFRTYRGGRDLNSFSELRFGVCFR